VYEIGDIGPAGGYVFYDKGSYSDEWRYLEAAPSDIPVSAYPFGFYKNPLTGSFEMVGTSTAVGTGEANTAALVAAMGSAAYISADTSTTTAYYAARLCDILLVGVYDDWFLPSLDELDLMYDNLKVNGLGGLSDANYWSSSENSYYNTWIEYFGWGSQATSNNFNSDLSGRAVRAF
jgi:hypothetical protein